MSPTMIPKKTGKKNAIKGLGSTSWYFGGRMSFMKNSKGFTNRGLS